MITLQDVADEFLLRFRDQWGPEHAAFERWLIINALAAEGKADGEEIRLVLEVEAMSRNT